MFVCASVFRDNLLLIQVNRWDWMWRIRRMALHPKLRVVSIEYREPSIVYEHFVIVCELQNSYKY